MTIMMGKLKRYHKFNRKSRAMRQRLICSHRTTFFFYMRGIINNEYRIENQFDGNFNLKTHTLVTAGNVSNFFFH